MRELCIQLESAIEWRDLVFDDDAALERCLEQYALPRWVMDECLGNERFPEVRRFPGGSYVRMSLRAAWDDMQSVFFTMIITARGIVTVHRESIALLEAIYERLSSGEASDIHDINHLLLYLLEEIVDNDVHCLLGARHSIMPLLAEVNPGSSIALQHDLQALSQKVGKLNMQFEDHLYCLSAVLTLQNSAAPTATIPAPGFRELFDTQNHLVRGASRLEARLGNVQDYFQHLVQAHTERRLRLLTLMSAIFMPLTLIAGIYGMNFQRMPELEWEYGYYVTVGGMLALGLGLTLFFYWRKWFQ